MSKRNSREGKALRRGERAARAERQQDPVPGAAHVQSYAELVDLAHRGATLPCGCDAHELLHEVGPRLFG